MAANYQRGFTIVELMIVVLVVAVLLAIAGPSFSKQIKDNRLLSETYALRAIYNKARAESMAQRVPVVFCPSSDGLVCGAIWNQGYLAFTDFDGDSVIDAGIDEIFVSKVMDPLGVTVAFSNAANRINFDSRGNALGFAGTLTFCDDRGASQGRALLVSAVGSIRAATDTDATPDGIVNDNAGANIVCP